MVFYGREDPRTTRQLTHRLVLENGPEAERWLLDLPIDSGNSPLLGQFARFEGPPRLTVSGDAVLGPAVEVSAISSTNQDPLLHSGRDRCPTPVAVRRVWRHELTVYPNTTSTIGLVRRLALTHAPPSGSLYQQNWDLTPVRSDGLPEHAAHARVEGVVPVPAGLEPARLSLRVRLTGTSRRVAAGERLTARAGSRLVVTGSLSPVERGRRVTLWRHAPGQSRARRLATARVDRRGDFVYRNWRPRAVGRWELYATFPGTPGVVERTRSPCGGPKVDVVRAGRGD